MLPTQDDLAAMCRSPRRDIPAGITVAVTALPLALGLGAASGLGASAGLASAVVAGALAALLGGSNLQISGPTGILTVVIAPIAQAYGPSGVFTAGLLAGALLVGLALTRASRCMRYVPAPVVKGFTVGSAAVIILQQFPLALGMGRKQSGPVAVAAARAAVCFAAHPHWAAPALALGVAAVRLAVGRLRPTAPAALVAVVAATAVARATHLPVLHIGYVPPGLPAPSLRFFDLSSLPHLLPSAVTVAILVAMESLMTAAAADAMTGDTPHDGDRELFGQGIANLAAPLFGGVAATGTVVRTAVNHRAGATSRLAGLVHSVVLVLLAFTAAPLVEEVPLAALAGVLIATAVRMVDVGALRMLARVDRGQAAVAAVTAAVTLAFDLVTAVAVGVALATVLALQAVARSARTEHQAVHLDPSAAGRAARQAAAPDHIGIYRIDGPLLFASADRLLEPVVHTQARVVVLRMSRVTAMDATGVLALRDTICALSRRGTVVLMCGIRDGHEQPMDALGMLAELRAGGQVLTEDSEADACARARLVAAALPPRRSSFSGAAGAG